MGIITTQGLNALAAALTSGTTVNIRRFFYADIPGVNAQTIPPQDSVLPPAAQIVYSDYDFSMGKSGNDSAVYSSVLLPDVGDFTFNAIGLETDKGELLAVHYQNPQQKIKTQNAIFGNRIKKYFVIRYANAADLTGATVEINEMAVDYATSEKPGIVELATAEEVNTGADNTRAVTPKTLNQKLEDAVKTLAPLNHTHAYAPENHIHGRAGEVVMTLDAGDYPGTLILNGQAVSRALYPALFAKYGTKYGSGDGVTTFNLPKMDDRFPRGASSAFPVGSTHEDAVQAASPTSLSANGECHIAGTGSGEKSFGIFLNSGVFGRKNSPYWAGARAGDSSSPGIGNVLTFNWAASVNPDSGRRTAAETRPKGMSFIFRVYYK